MSSTASRDAEADDRGAGLQRLTGPDAGHLDIVEVEVRAAVGLAVGVAGAGAGRPFPGGGADVEAEHAIEADSCVHVAHDDVEDDCVQRRSLKAVAPVQIRSGLLVS